MKQILSITLVVLIFATTSCRVIKVRDSYAFSKNATASLSRVKLFLENQGTKNAPDLYVQPTVFWSQFDATKRSSLVAIMPDPDNRKLANIKVLAENT